MSYIALYRKWRPKVFDDVVEQEHVVKTLKNAVKSSRIAHAYLFCGTRGTGKTTLAKIFARAINCLNPQDGNPCNTCEICRGILSDSVLDVIEIDAASNNSVDNIREIKDVVNYAPSHARYKVYIIDEVHMLSTGAFNALLKTLEEPPEHVVFILATTDPHKLPATILSRCQRYDFRRISLESIAARIENIASETGVTLYPDAARLIARMADGAMRDAISVLDQVIATGITELKYDDVIKVVGVVDDALLSDTAKVIKSGDIGAVLKLVDDVVMQGKNAGQFVSDLIVYFRNLLVCLVTDNPGTIIDASSEAMSEMKKLAAEFSRDELMYIIKELSLLESGMKWSGQHRILLEVALIRICESGASLANDSLPDRLTALEKRMEGVRAMPAGTGTAAGNTANRGAGTHTVQPSGVKPAKKPDIPKPDGQKPDAGAASVEEWKQIVDELKSSGRMALFTYLLDTGAVWLSRNVIGIVFAENCGFNKTVVSKAENSETIEAAAARKLGREVRVKCISGNDLANVCVKEKLEEKDDFLEKAQDLAKRLDAPINIIDG